MSVRTTYNYWKKGFERSGLIPEKTAEYLAYIKPLLKQDLPIIFDFEHLCLLLGCQASYLASVVNANKCHYRSFDIPKRSGGRRIITAPYSTLLHCQRWIYQHILLKVPIHPSAHGFCYKKSIITNAKVHIGQNHFLKIDLEDFFPSIKINQVINVFKSLGYTQMVSFYLASICCYEDSLPQGAPTSPVLSNIIAKHMDNRLMKFARRFQFKYTRYADDLAFSGERITAKHLEYITGIIESCGFIINEDKTLLKQSKQRRIITGLSIAGEQIRLPREYKRNLKLEIHHILKNGWVLHMRNRRIKNPDYQRVIVGKINFWLSVEPENEFAKRALEQLKVGI